MQVLASTVLDWEACGPEDGGVAAERLPEILDLAANLVLDAPAPSQLQQCAYMMLEPEGGEAMGDGGQPALLELMLLRGLPAGGGDRRINFLRFWQAWQELWARLGHAAAEAEPIAEEMAAFRDALLRRASATECLAEDLAAEVAGARQMSSDQAAWAPLEESVELLRDGGCASSRFRFSELAAPENLELLSVCELILLWMRGVIQDYRVGPRSAKIRAVVDVCGCSPRDACFQLGGRGWDVEAAIMGHYSSGAGGASPSGGPPDAVSWSSQGAKLRRSEVECPICAEPYAGGAKRVVLPCCFQVICKACQERMVQPVEGRWSEVEFQCPFCRGVDRHAACLRSAALAPSAARAQAAIAAARRRSDETRLSLDGAIGGLFRVAGEAGQALVDIVAALREDPMDRRRSPHLDAEIAGEEYSRRQQLRNATRHIQTRARDSRRPLSTAA